MDVDYDMSAFGNSTSLGALDNLAPESVELDGQRLRPPRRPYDHGVLRFNAQNSRFLVETRTPTAYGEIKTYIELDFAGQASIQRRAAAPAARLATRGRLDPDQRQPAVVARMKQAYGTLGPWLFGQANSNYRRSRGLADTLDALRRGRHHHRRRHGQDAADPLHLPAADGHERVGLDRRVRDRRPVRHERAPAAPASFIVNNFNAPGYQQKFPAVDGHVRRSSSPGAMPASTSPWRKFAHPTTWAAASALTTTAGRLPRRALGLSAEPDRSLQHDRQGQDHLDARYGQGAGHVYLGAEPGSARRLSEDLICYGDAPSRPAPTFACSQPRNMRRQCRLLALVDRRVAQRRGARLRPDEPAERGGRLDPRRRSATA